MGSRNCAHVASGAARVKAGVPGSAATCPSTKLKIVVSLPDLTAKQAAHGPAQVPSTASAAQAFRHAAALGNPVIAGTLHPEPEILAVTVPEPVGIANRGQAFSAGLQ